MLVLQFGSPEEKQQAMVEYRKAQEEVLSTRDGLARSEGPAIAFQSRQLLDVA